MAFQSGQNRLGRRQARNLNGPLGDVKASLTVFLVWLGGILIGAILLTLLVIVFGGGSNSTRTLPTSREAIANLYQQPVIQGDKIYNVENGGLVEARGDAIKGESYYRRICIGCHYGGYTYSGQLYSQANGPGVQLGHLYGQQLQADGTCTAPAALTNQQTVTDANVLQFILKGHSNMPAGIPTAQQAVDLVSYLKLRTNDVYDPGKAEQKLPAGTVCKPKPA